MTSAPSLVPLVLRCAYVKGLPELLGECKRMGLRTKVVTKAGSLVFRANFARAQMQAALAEVNDDGLHSWETLKQAVLCVLATPPCLLIAFPLVAPYISNCNS